MKPAKEPKLTPLGARVRRLRKKGGLSQRELAWLATTSPGYPWHVETGRVVEAGSDFAIAFARVFGCSLEFLLTGSGKEPNERQVRAAVAAARKAKPKESQKGAA